MQNKLTGDNLFDPKEEARTFKKVVNNYKSINNCVSFSGDVGQQLDLIEPIYDEDDYHEFPSKMVYLHDLKSDIQIFEKHCNFDVSTLTSHRAKQLIDEGKDPA